MLHLSSSVSLEGGRKEEGRKKGGQAGNRHTQKEGRKKEGKRTRHSLREGVNLWQPAVAIRRGDALRAWLSLLCGAAA